MHAARDLARAPAGPSSLSSCRCPCSEALGREGGQVVLHAGCHFLLLGHWVSEGFYSPSVPYWLSVPLGLGRSVQPQHRACGLLPSVPYWLPVLPLGLRGLVQPHSGVPSVPYRARVRGTPCLEGVPGLVVEVVPVGKLAPPQPVAS